LILRAAFVLGHNVLVLLAIRFFLVALFVLRFALTCLAASGYAVGLMVPNAHKSAHGIPAHGGKW
jgi:hypothetical protein